MESDLNVKKYNRWKKSNQYHSGHDNGIALLPFFDAATDDVSAQAKWTDTELNFNGANVMAGDNKFAARRSLLLQKLRTKSTSSKTGEPIFI